MLYRSARHSEAGRARINGQPSRWPRRIGCESTSHDYELTPANRRGRNACAHRWMHDPGKRIPRIPVAGLPHPAAALRETPAAVPIRHPAPRISGHPHVAEAGIPGPCAILKRAPAGAGEEGLPAESVARAVHVAAVVIQIAHAIGIGRLNVMGTAADVAVVILSLLLVPVVVRILFEVPGDLVGVAAEVKGRGVLFGDLEFARRSRAIYLALEHGQRCLGCG